MDHTLAFRPVPFTNYDHSESMNGRPVSRNLSGIRQDGTGKFDLAVTQVLEYHTVDIHRAHASRSAGVHLDKKKKKKNSSPVYLGGLALSASQQ